MKFYAIYPMPNMGLFDMKTCNYKTFEADVRGSSNVSE